jgi:hypothetical protein
MNVKNPKSEIRNPKQIQNRNFKCSKLACRTGFEHFFFGFPICFGFRISDFGFLLFIVLCAAATNAPDQIPPLRAPRGELPPGFWEEHGLLVVIGSVLALTLLGVVAWFFTRPKPVVPPAPETVARQALEPLSRQPEDGAVLSHVSQVLRQYLVAVFGLPPEEMTCTEFCRALRGHEAVGPELSAAIAEFLVRNDERKFAPAPPSPAMSAVAQALRFVEAAQRRLVQLRLAASRVPPTVAPPEQP